MKQSTTRSAVKLAMDLRKCPDDQLLRQLGTLVARQNATTAAILTHLAEVDRRKLYLQQRACSSLFAYCIEVLHMSESATAKRIQAARAAAHFPIVLTYIDEGAMHLCGIALLAPHLTEDNHEALLSDARCLSKRAIEKLIATRFPRPDIAPSVRKLPTRRQSPTSPSAAPLTQQNQAAAPTPSGAPTPSDATRAATVAQPALPVQQRAKDRDPVVAPLSETRYQIRFTASESLRDKLMQAQDLLGVSTSKEIETVVECALDALIEQQLKAKFGVGAGPRGETRTKGQPNQKRSRHVPVAVRRAVYQRDRGRCAFVGPSGHRCKETRYLELHHCDPYARGGAHTVANLALRCRAHNAFEAQRDFGGDYVARAIAQRRSGGGVS